MRQYDEIKTAHPDALLLFRVGDFYETFGEDAKTAAECLNIVLTKRSNGSASETALAGFPHHALQTYLPKLVKAGHRVAIVEQLEDPKTVKGLVKRGVTDMITPGMNLNDAMLNSKEHNFIAALNPGKKFWGLSIMDLSTGAFYYAYGSQDQVTTALSSFAPKEIVHPRGMDRALRLELDKDYYLYGIEDWVWEINGAMDQINDKFGTQGVRGFGLEKKPEATIAVGTLLWHLSKSEMGKLDHITTLQRIALEDFMWLDGFTARNLELHFPNTPGGISTVEVIDKTLSPMGGRMLRRWLSMPLLSISQITARQDCVASLLDQDAQLEDMLGNISDIERLVSRVATGRISPRELKRLAEALIHADDLQGATAELQIAVPMAAPENMRELAEALNAALAEDPPVIIGKGESIGSAHNEELAHLRQLLTNATDTLEEIRERESQATGIPSLKLAFNNVFGYYLEVRNAHKDKVPEGWHRKQTLVNAERYITDELKKFEAEVLGAEEKIKAIELKLFAELVQQTAAQIPNLQATANWVGALDVCHSFAVQAKRAKYVRPTMVEEGAVQIEKGRHPVIENVLPEDSPYIPNDLTLAKDKGAIAMITGPNMSGKSAVLRQTALIQILAQCGSYVPATSATLPIIDRVFVRVGASDNLAAGESTFMVEMNETALILNNISARSLIILDEIGRGTSTFDGVSIAWGIAEFLHQHPDQPLVLFATHYHELAEMAQDFPRIANYHIAVEEHEGDMIFLRQLRPGGTAHSFGLHVAKLAGVPGYVLHRAKDVLAKLEAEKGTVEGTAAPEPGMQLNFFTVDRPELERIGDELSSLDVNQLTPVEALMLLHTLQEKLKK